VGDLDGRVAVITGGGSGIGAATARRFAAEGASIAVFDRDPETASAVAAEVEGHAYAVDVRDGDEVTEVIDRVAQTFGQIDILVNNAAFFNKKGVLDMSLAEWRAQTDVILTGAFLLTKYVARSMIKRRAAGRILNIISTAGHQGEPGNIAYSTAKCGLLNFTRSAAMELVGHNIRVNSLTPTATDPAESFERAARWGRQTRVPAGLAAVMEPFRRGIPMQRLPKPTDYGLAAAFLVSDDAAMITGTDLRVDAGAVARYWAWDPGAAAAKEA
jgi:NAD(P)-dependent dehydrogenase (short-subunit alcohol dehydrogenase family)